MNIQDYLNKYKGKYLNLIITDIKLNCNAHNIDITATSGFGIETIIKVPIDTDLDNLCIREVNKSSEQL